MKNVDEVLLKKPDLNGIFCGSVSLGILFDLYLIYEHAQEIRPTIFRMITMIVYIEKLHVHKNKMNFYYIHNIDF